MPPRKSMDAKPSAAKGAEDETPSRATAKSKDGLAIEDLTLPRTMIQRLAKGVLPANTQIHKDALLAIHKSATVFVSYLADSANDRAVLANKKTILPKDVFEALAELEFEAFLPRCEAELNLYNTVQCTKRNDYRRRVKSEREAASESALLAAADAHRNGDGSNANGASSSPGSASKTNGIAIRGRDSPPAAKKARVSLSGAGHGAAGNADSDFEDAEEEAEDDNEDEDEAEPASGEEEEMEDDEDGDSVGEEAEDSLDRDEEGRYGGEDEEDLGGSESE